MIKNVFHSFGKQVCFSVGESERRKNYINCLYKMVAFLLHFLIKKGGSKKRSTLEDFWAGKD